MSGCFGRDVGERKEAGQKNGLLESSIAVSRIQRPFSNGKPLSALFLAKDSTLNEGGLNGRPAASARLIKEVSMPNRVARSKTAAVLQNQLRVCGGSSHGDFSRARSFTASARAACVPKTSVSFFSGPRGAPLSRTTSVVMRGKQVRCDGETSSESSLALQETSVGVRPRAQKLEAAAVGGVRRAARPPVTRRFLPPSKELVSDDMSVAHRGEKGCSVSVSRPVGKGAAPRVGREKSGAPSGLSRERLESRGVSDIRNVSRKRGVSEQRVFRGVLSEKDLLRQNIVEKIQSVIAQERILRAEAKAFQGARETHNKMENALARKIVLTKTVEAALERVISNLRETLRREQESAATEKEKVARLSREVLVIDAELEEEQRTLRETQCLIEVARSKQKNAAALLAPLGEKAKRSTLNLSILEKRLAEELKAEEDLEASMHVLAKDIFWICRLWNAKGGRNEKVAIGVTPPPPINGLMDNIEKTKKELQGEKRTNMEGCDFEVFDVPVSPSSCYAISMMREDDSTSNDVAQQQSLTVEPVRLPVSGVPTAWISVRSIPPESQGNRNGVSEPFSACSFSVPFDRVIEHDPMHRPHGLLAVDWEKFVASAPDADTQQLLEAFVTQDQSEKENRPLFDTFGQQQVVGSIETLMREAIFPSVAGLPKPSAIGFICLGVGSVSVDSGSVWGSQETTKESEVQVQEADGDTKCVGIVEAGLRALFKECDKLNGKDKEKGEPKKPQPWQPFAGLTRERCNRSYYVRAAIVTEDAVRDVKKKLNGCSDFVNEENGRPRVGELKNQTIEKKAAADTMAVGPLEELLIGHGVAGLGNGMHLQRPAHDINGKENGCLGSMTSYCPGRLVPSDPELPNWMTFDVSGDGFNEASFFQMEESKQPHCAHSRSPSPSSKEGGFGFHREVPSGFVKSVLEAPASESQHDQDSPSVLPIQFAVYDSVESLLGQLRKQPHVLGNQKTSGFGVVVDVLLHPSADAEIEPQRALTVLFLNLRVPPQEVAGSLSVGDPDRPDMWRASGSSVTQDLATFEVLREIMRFPRVVMKKKKSPAPLTSRSLRDGTGAHTDGRSVPTSPRVASSAVQRQQSTFQRTSSMTPSCNASMEEATQDNPALPAKSHLGRLMQLFNSRVKQDASAGSVNGGPPSRGGCLTVITDVHSPTTDEAHEVDLLAALWRVIEARSAEASSLFIPGARY